MRGNASFHFAEYGPKSGFPLLYFHGYPSSRLEVRVPHSARSLPALEHHRPRPPRLRPLHLPPQPLHHGLAGQCACAGGPSGLERCAVLGGSGGGPSGGGGDADVDGNRGISMPRRVLEVAGVVRRVERWLGRLDAVKGVEGPGGVERLQEGKSKTGLAATAPSPTNDDNDDDVKPSTDIKNAVSNSSNSSLKRLPTAAQETQRLTA
ncbi:hypothetical protein BDDG_06330 [Blastomyces dermatitidis ATCC 18188]|uniref:Uncharacterized protein n=1 Tax=Ajellomyces dermatitidis (strain ATCC 18188 / CBS 674.68) TaxID=653446 RepID=F2TJH3_AJEDA|nr:hypothetical protein BDDG_06330 [Blastomyces dermatitidis ATCC 18188]